MTTYLNDREIRVSLKKLVQQYVEECETCKEMPEEFISLIKHNFLAKFVYYNKQEKQIEIGIDESESPNTYPKIKVFKFPVKKAVKWLDKSFKDNKNDLEFYGKLLKRNSELDASEVVLVNK